MKQVANYIGQIRIYSLIPFVLFITTFSDDLIKITSLSLLWIGFLIYLEVSHKDPLRLRFFTYLWVPFIIPALVVATQETLFFMFFSFLYAKKKDSAFWGGTSSLWRGLQNFSLAILTSPIIASIALVLIYFRNLIGDIRDAGHDKKSNTITLPVLLGIFKNCTIGYYGHLGIILFSSVLWWYISLFSIPLHTLIILLFVQAISYPLTPRISCPNFLNFYKKNSL